MVKLRAGRMLRERAKFTYVPRYVEDVRLPDVTTTLRLTGFDRVMKPKVRRG